MKNWDKLLFSRATVNQHVSMPLQAFIDGKEIKSNRSLVLRKLTTASVAAKIRMI